MRSSRLVPLALALSIPAAVGCAQPVHQGVQPHAAVDPFTETPEQRDARMAWWRDARFGMFIHWGLYAVPAGQWGQDTHHAEWIRTSAQIPLGTYDALVGQFNPVNFDAAAWARMAREAGMKYIVITTKHHDGFCLWDSAHTDFDVMSTPFKRDIIRELADAARAEGRQIGFYHSIMDWHHPDYLPRRDWETSRASDDADFERFEEYLHAQVTELLTNYGPIGVMWFDGEWEQTWTQQRGRDLYALCRRLQPDIIVNNRVAKARDGMAGLSLGGQFAGDFGTPEQEVPPTGLPGVDWESCMTMNDHWGYNAFDHNWKSTTDLVRTLVDIASKGGNYLLNVGPRADGTFPPEAVDRLREIGAWMRQHGSAITGTRAGPFGSLPWGRTTVSSGGAGRSTRLYLHLFETPDDDRLVLPGLATDPTDARLLGADGPIPSPRLASSRQHADLVVTGLPEHPTSPHSSVILLQFDRGIDVYPAPTIAARSSDFLDPITVTLAHPRSTDEHPLDLRYTLDSTDPSAASPIYDGPLILNDTTTLRVQAWRAHTPLSPVAARTFTRVVPLPPVHLASPRHGQLTSEQYRGTWDRLPDFDRLTPDSTSQSHGLDLETRIADERFAVRFSGFLYIRNTGLYRFSLASDDGSRLWIAGRLLIDNDGLHVEQAKEGSIALEAGYHPIRVEYFNRTGQRALSLHGEMAGLPMREIPASGFALDAP